MRGRGTSSGREAARKEGGCEEADPGKLCVRRSVIQSRGCSCQLFSVREGAGKMVNVLKGVLVECDPAMKQFLLYLDESNALGKKFIIQDLDETHVFVLAELVNFLQERVGELMDQNSFPITQK
ncbi:general transcription factor IIH subunit 5 isoform X1 [Agelaius phoeniceus]|uniref:general transcription factor IIH subunit 5 isoform X1 n=1 Tax=Agelaius phoeniceus TaxID=39638 RepID=UPI00405510BB